MRKLVLLLAALALAAVPSLADAAGKKGKKAAKAKAPPAAAKTATPAEPPVVTFFRVGTSAPLNVPGGAAPAGGAAKDKGKKAAKKK
jgi:hypothetical protein